MAVSTSNSKSVERPHQILVFILGTPLLVLIALTIWVLKADERMVFGEAQDRAAEISNLLIQFLLQDGNVLKECHDITREVGSRLSGFGRVRGHSIKAHSDLSKNHTVNSPILDELVLGWPESMSGLIHSQGLHLDKEFYLKQIGSRATTIRPGDYSMIPLPHEDRLESLTIPQATFWRQWNATLNTMGDLQGVLDRMDQAEALLPEDYKVLCRYQLAQSLSEDGDRQSALSEFRKLTQRTVLNPETGLPIASIAAWHVFQEDLKSWIEKHQDRLQSNWAEKDLVDLFRQLEAVLISQPSLLTGKLLDKALMMAEKAGADVGRLRIHSRWTTDETTRGFVWFLRDHHMEQLRSSKVINGFWVNWKDIDWLVVVTPKQPGVHVRDGLEYSDGYTLQVIHEDVLREAFYRNLVLYPLKVPDFASIELGVFGKRLLEFHSTEDMGYPSEPMAPHYQGDTAKILIKSRKPADPSYQVLYQTAFPIPGLFQDGGQFRVLLSHPAILYRRQQLRGMMFLGLLVMTGVITVLGLVFLLKTLRQQATLAQKQINFISSVSHELRAPVASIQILTESLRDQRVNSVAKIHQYYQDIIGECRRLTRQINLVLDFTRLEQGQHKNSFQSVDVADLLQEVTASMTPLAAEKGIHIRISPACLPDENADVGLFCMMNRVGMFQVFQNLLDNAIKHAPHGTDIELGWNEQAGGGFNFYVSDHGPGVPMSEREKIFDRFYRVGYELTRETSGAGIGLYLVKEIIADHHGHIRVVDTEGGGARFEIQLPNRIPENRTV